MKDEKREIKKFFYLDYVYFIFLGFFFSMLKKNVYSKKLKINIVESSKLKITEMLRTFCFIII